MDEWPDGDVAEGAAPRRGDASSPRSSSPRRRLSVVGVIGEILLTAGVITLLFVVWQLWLGDLIYGAQRNAAGEELSQTWAQQSAPAPGTDALRNADRDPYPDSCRSGDGGAGRPAAARPMRRSSPSCTSRDSARTTPCRWRAASPVPAPSTPSASGTIPASAMPGDVGNFAVAAHRTTWGKPFNRLADLHVGDAIVIETPDGWYTYRFRTPGIRHAQCGEVLLPVPQATAVAAGTRYITMTSCSPMYSMTRAHRRLRRLRFVHAAVGRGPGLPH